MIFPVNFLQCFDTVDWETGTASAACKTPLPHVPAVFLPNNWRKKLGETGYPTLFCIALPLISVLEGKGENY